MRNRLIILAIILSFLFVYVAMNIFQKAYTVETVEENQGFSPLPFRKGERLTYEVRCKNLKVGKSILTFHGEKDLGDKKVYHITFYTNIPSFNDTEELYADKKSFLPVEVHRSIKKRFGFNDRIKEIYDQENFRVDIENKSKLRSKRLSLQKDFPIHNAILLTYYYRTQPDFSEVNRFKISLPTVDFEVMFSGIETIQTPLGERRAYCFTSEPPKFKFWLSVDEKRIPLKIHNPGKLGYSLIIKSID